MPMQEPPLVDLVSMFRSFGDNCEFGLVQREAGAEPIDLLRFAGLYIPTGHLTALTDAIIRGFDGLGQPGTVACALSDLDGHGRREFYVQEQVYQLRYHTFRYHGQIEVDRLRDQQEHALQFWRLKLLDDLRSADKVCLWKSNHPQDESDVRGLLTAIRDYGPNTLLWVTPGDRVHEAGTVEDLGDGLFKGYIARLAPYGNAADIDLDAWYAVCLNAYQMIPMFQNIERTTAKPAIYDGSLDGIIDGRACGWCLKVGDPNPVTLQLYIDGKRVSTFVAKLPHARLKNIGIGSGNHGFYSPAALRDLPRHAVITVRVQGTGFEVSHSGRPLSEYQWF